MFGNDSETVKKICTIMEKSIGLAKGITAWVVLSKEGLPIASAVPRQSETEEAEISAMAASILGVADLAAERLEQGALKEVIITNENGHLVMTGAGENAIIAIAALENAKTGMLVYAAKSASEEIKLILDMM